MCGVCQWLQVCGVLVLTASARGSVEHCCHKVVFWFGYRCVFVSGNRCVVFASGYTGVVFDVWKTVQPQGGVLAWL